jgi:rsbT co-antagonist protein RsbR
MADGDKSGIPGLLLREEARLLADWIAEQASSGIHRDDLMREGEMREQSTRFLKALQEAAQAASLTDTSGPAWRTVRDTLEDVARSRALQGFTAREVAQFVFSLKRPLFARLGQTYDNNAARLAEEVWTATRMLDDLGLWTTEVYQTTREEVIQRQQQDMLELSTPVVKLWDGILALPVIGTLDSARTQVVMETLLTRIVETGSQIAIIDITGVPTVDTLVAQHLLKTVAATRLMGAECIISGIRPQIAQTIVHLGVDLSDVVTKATLADAIVLALERSGTTLARIADGS